MGLVKVSHRNYPLEYVNRDKIIVFKNCRILRDGIFSQNDDQLCIRNGKVVDPKEIFYSERRHCDTIVDCKFYTFGIIGIFYFQRGEVHACTNWPKNSQKSSLQFASKNSEK